MKRMDIFCASQASTAICLGMDQASSSSSSSSSAVLGGKAIDRHNPIIRDSKRFTRTALPISPCISQPAPVEPQPCQIQYHQVPKTKKSKQSDKKAKKKSPLKENEALTPRANGSARTSNQLGPPQLENLLPEKNHVVSWQEQNDAIITSREASNQLGPPQLENALPEKSFSEAREKNQNHVISRDKVVSSRKNWAQIADLVTPPDSSRYLLSESTFFNGITDYEPVATLAPIESNKSLLPAVKQEESIAPQSEKPSIDQVVVLRVSLHCKGCEGKVRKHLSKMEGVTSFNIDFKAKKVTIVGNVTPLGVLASVSKVKNAQFWTVPTWSPTATPCNFGNLEARK